MRKKFYAILRGRRNNYITESWEECKSMVYNYPGAIYRAFDSWYEAAVYLNYNLKPNKPYDKHRMKRIEPVTFYANGIKV